MYRTGYYRFGDSVEIIGVTPRYPLDSMVGAWLATHELLKSLVVAGHNVRVFTSFNNKMSSYVLDGVKVLRASKGVVPLSSADVLISHLGDNGHAHRAALELGVPSVRMVHGGVSDHKVLAGSVLAVCNSEATKYSISKWVGDKVVIHPPTDPNMFATTPGDKVTLINLCAEKGGEVFWRVALANPNIEFLGVMGGYNGQLVIKSPNVEVVPTTTNMKDDVYARTKVLLMPSFRESWGMVAVEAMYSGIPVIARPTAGIRECLGSAGIFEDSSSTKGWSLQLRRLLMPDEWLKASSLCLERVSKFTPEEDKARFVKSIEAVIGKGKL